MVLLDVLGAFRFGGSVKVKHRVDFEWFVTEGNPGKKKHAKIRCKQERRRKIRFQHCTYTPLFALRVADPNGYVSHR